MTASEDQEQARKGANSEKPGAGVGAILRGARLARDEDLREVAAALRIRLPYLQAIESGAIEDLPGVTYGIGFVRAYASYLDLDSNEIVDRFKIEARGMTQRTQLQFPEPLPGNRVPGAALLLIVLLLAGGVYGVWLYSSSQNMTVIEAVQAVPDRLRSLIEEEPAQEISSTPDTATDTATVPPVETVPEADQTEDTAAMPATDGTTSETTASDTSSIAPMPSTTASDATATETPAPVTDTAQTSANSDIPTPPAQPETTASETTTSETAAPESTPSGTPLPETTTAAQQQTDALPEPQIPAAPPQPTATQTAPVEEGTSSPPQTAEGSAMTTENLPEPTAPAATAPVPETSTPGTQATESAPSPSAPQEIPAQPGTQAAEAQTTPTETTTPSAITTDDSRIIIQATQESWIQVKNAQGQILIEKLMLMGEIYRVPNRPGLTLSSGNIGALKLIVNGTMVPTIGSLGEVRRGIPLTPESLLP